MKSWGWSLMLAGALGCLGVACASAAEAGASNGTTAATAAASAEPSFADWKAACLRTPANRVLRGNLPPPELLPLPKFREVGQRLSEYFAQCQAGSLAQSKCWVGEVPTAAGFLNPLAAYFLAPEAPTTGLIQKFLAGSRTSPAMGPATFQPFAHKLEIPVGSEVFLHADYHGDIRSLMAELSWLNEQGYLNGFRIARPDFHLVFFGDFADRGSYGVEVLYTLLRLKLANGDRVVLGRGNHEEISIASRYGLLSEGQVKYGAEFDVRKLMRAFDFFPVVTYVGSAGNYVQCNHGGMEPGFDPRPLLASASPVAFSFLGDLKQRTFLSTHPEWTTGMDGASRDALTRSLRDFRPADPIQPLTLGFMWNDFSITADEPEFSIDPGRAFVYGARATRYLLQQTRTNGAEVRAVFRGHQQASVLNPMMRRLIASDGVFRHWQAGDSLAKVGAEVRELSGILERGAERAIPAGSVWTFNISPDTAYGEACGMTTDAFAILKTAREFSDWRLKVISLNVMK